MNQPAEHTRKVRIRVNNRVRDRVRFRPSKGAEPGAIPVRNRGGVSTPYTPGACRTCMECVSARKIQRKVRP